MTTKADVFRGRDRGAYTLRRCTHDDAFKLLDRSRNTSVIIPREVLITITRTCPQALDQYFEYLERGATTSDADVKELASTAVSPLITAEPLCTYDSECSKVAAYEVDGVKRCAEHAAQLLGPTNWRLLRIEARLDQLLALEPK